MSLKIFLSHAWNDKNLAAFKAIETRLAEGGHQVWVDKRQIEFGEAIPAKIEQGLRDADIVLVLWSKHAHESSDVIQEIETAGRLGKLVIPCKITDYEPEAYPPFREKKYLRFDGHHLELGIVHLSQFLIRLQSQRSTAVRADAGLQSQIGALHDVLAEFDDWAFRKGKGVTGNEASSTYIDRMLAMGKRLVDASNDPPAEKARLTSFFQQMQEVARAYPDPSQEAIKNAAIGTAIERADPRGESQILQTFKSMLAQIPQATAGPPPPPPLQFAKPMLIQQLENHIAAVHQLPNSAQALRQHLARILPPDQIQPAEAALLSMIGAVPQILTAIATAGDQAQIGHLLAPIIQTAAQYFLQPNDLIPDQAGALGLLDDTYLVHAFLYHINATFAAHTGRPLIAVDISNALNLVRAVLGPVITQQLDQAVVQTVNAIAQQHYAQQLAQWQQTNQMSAVQFDPERGSWGGTTEDEIARLSAKIRANF